MQIANGRFRGDCWGNYTHHNKNKGQSSVDMAVISDNLFPLTEDFKILPQTEHSDHSKIVLTIGNLCTTPTPATNKYIWRDKNREYKWNDDFNFTKAFNSPDIKSLLNERNQYIEAGIINPSGKSIQQIFNKVAENSLEIKKFQTKKTKSGKTKHPKKWFDTECLRLKNRSRKLANLKHKNPWNKSLLQSHRNILKDFKKLCNYKKHKFWREEITKLNQSRDNNISFWKNWKGFGENIVYNQLPEEANGQE